jgi:iron complex transport system substrate-binding protein
MHDVSRRTFLSVSGALALAGCGAPERSDTAATGGRWEYTDDLGITVTLPERPTRIVAYVSGAAALWDFGVRPVGVYGQSRNDDGSPTLQAGSVDLEAVASVGEGYDGVDLERLAALEPDLMIASLAGPTADSRWVIKDDLAQIQRICPVYSIQEANTSLPDVIGAYEVLADRLGGNAQDPAVAQARTDFLAAGEELKAALAEKPGLRVEFAYADTDAFYVADPRFYPTLIWYARLGMDIARQDDPSSDFLQQLSWEEVGRYPADLICTDVRTFSLPQQEIIARFPTFANLPAVRAGQLGGYNGEPRFSYQQAVAEVRDLAAAVRRAQPGIA